MMVTPEAKVLCQDSSLVPLHLHPPVARLPRKSSSGTRVSQGWRTAAWWKMYS